jgi:tetrahydromethanopterin S-methyltransferase subunit F
VRRRALVARLFLNRRIAMRSIILAAAAVAVLPLSACATNGGGLFGDSRYDSRYERREAIREARRDAARDYRDDVRYQERVLSRNDRIYRGSDGRYYCDRPDGTTGLIIGGLGGGVLGNIIAPGGSETIGTLIGAGAGALIGREIERGNAKCR